MTMTEKIEIYLHLNWVGRFKVSKEISSNKAIIQMEGTNHSSKFDSEANNERELRFDALKFIRNQHISEAQAEPEVGTAQHIADIFIGTGSLSLFKDDTSQGVFGIDSSFIEQNFGDDEPIRVREPFNGLLVELIFE